ncbi:MAG: isochorismate synthase MenF [Acidimicrobiales bacterium]
MTNVRLSAQARELDDSTFAALRAHAFAKGAVIERDECSVLAFGRSEVIRLPSGLTDPAALDEVTERLVGLGAVGAAGGRAAGWELPMVVGALPFLPDRAAELVIPEVTVSRVPEGIAAVTVAPSGGHEALFSLLEAAAAGSRHVVAEPTAQPPDGFRLESARSHADFLARVANAIVEVRSGRLDKVVLAREVVIEANRAFRQGDLLERLRSLHPSCTTFCIDGFLGASPELLIRRTGNLIESEPLAGTAARSGDPEVDRRIEAELLSSEKEREEHRAVVDSIALALAPVMASLDLPDSPEIVELRNVSHLRTRIRGVLAARQGAGRLPTALGAVALIHPTPAVSGSPIETALEYLAKSEDLDRGRYAGPVGWMRADGDGEFHLGIRSAVVTGTSARLFAGVGIVADSDPGMELRETQLKLQAVLAAAVRP